jgi:hypothetical protein
MESKLLSEVTHVGLEFDELEATAVHFDDLLGVALFLSFVGLGCVEDGSRVGFLCCRCEL